MVRFETFLESDGRIGEACVGFQITEQRRTVRVETELLRDEQADCGMREQASGRVGKVVRSRFHGSQVGVEAHVRAHAQGVMAERAPWSRALVTPLI